MLRRASLLVWAAVPFLPKESSLYIPLLRFFTRFKSFRFVSTNILEWIRVSWAQRPGALEITWETSKTCTIFTSEIETRIHEYSVNIHDIKQILKAKGFWHMQLPTRYTSLKHQLLFKARTRLQDSMSEWEERAATNNPQCFTTTRLHFVFLPLHAVDVGNIAPDWLFAAKAPGFAWPGSINCRCFAGGDCRLEELVLFSPWVTHTHKD